jgi:hypothetical protein
MDPLVFTRPGDTEGGAARVVLSIAASEFEVPPAGWPEPAHTETEKPTLYWDANWLAIDVRVEHEGRVFSRRDPCLETRDLLHIAKFFEKCAAAMAVFAAWGRPRLRSTLSFTEPNLELEVHSGPPCALRVYLAAECVPPFAQELDHTPAYDEDENVIGVSSVWLDFPISAVELREAAERVGNWATAFPARDGGRGLGSVPPVTEGSPE